MALSEDIKIYRSQGYGDKVIKSLLLKAGNSEKDIDEAFPRADEEREQYSPKKTETPKENAYRKRAKKYLWGILIVLAILATIFSLFKYKIISLPRRLTDFTSVFQKTAESNQIAASPGRCLLVEEKYCPGAPFIFPKTNARGIGFVLPQGTEIFSPISGKLLAGETTDTNPKYPTIMITGSLSGKQTNVWLDNVSTGILQETEVKAGQPIGTVASGAKIDQGDFNFDFAASANISKSLYADVFGK